MTTRLDTIIISIHPPRAGRDCNWGYNYLFQRISIHPPRAGRDLVPRLTVAAFGKFQSTRPVRGGT